jgi:hypothetical protein
MRRDLTHPNGYRPVCGVPDILDDMVRRRVAYQSLLDSLSPPESIQRDRLLGVQYAALEGGISYPALRRALGWPDETDRAPYRE